MIKIAMSSIQYTEQISWASIFAFAPPRARLFRNQRLTPGLLGRIDSRSPTFGIDLGLFEEVKMRFAVSFLSHFAEEMTAVGIS